MPLSYSKIFKQAYFLVRQHKFLWTFGLFLIWGSVINLVLILSSKDSTSYQQETEKVLSWFDTAPVSLDTISVAIGLFLLLLFFLYFRAKAAILICTRAILDKQPTGIRLGLNVSRLFYGRIAGVILTVGFTMLAACVVLFFPVFNLANQGFEARAMLLGMFALFILIPLSLVITFITALAPIFIVSHDLKIGESIRASFNLVSKHWLPLLMFTMLQTLIIIIAFFICLFVISLFLLPFVFFSPLIYKEYGFEYSTIFLTLGFTLSMLSLVVVQSGVLAFREVSWVLFFDQLVRPIKSPETAEPAPVPEVVS